ncbi:MAG: gliding motility protein GldN [Saprospiraceae bacterium]|nr:gliding motility protein GldN [Saprospiraceae bacterium]
MHKLKVFNVVFFSFLLSINIFAQEEVNEIESEVTIVEDNNYVDGVVARKVIKEQRVLSRDNVREADVVWEKKIWRVLDTREKLNQKFVEFEKPFINIILDAASRGEIKVFEEDNFKKFLTKNKIEKILHKVDTIEIYDPEKYITVVKEIKTDLDLSLIKTFRIKEVWYFDKESSRLECKILGIAPMKVELDAETGIEKYEAPLFWVYYPEARNIFSKELVFNNSNDASPGTWSDVFDGRAFSSYIYKENNVQGYRLKDKFEGQENEGVKVLLEADKIKNRLLNFEHDLWTY